MKVGKRDLKSLGSCGRAGSIPALGTIKIKGLQKMTVNPFFMGIGGLARHIHSQIRPAGLFDPK